MKMCYISVLFYVFTIAISDVLCDPCSSHAVLPRAEYRGGKCHYNQDKPVCDRGLRTGWYRANSTTGDLQIQTSPAEFLKCGTRFPIWMNGSHPTVGEGAVDRTVCETCLNSSCCSIIEIKVQNCVDFHVYYLQDLPTCDLGYCFGGNDDCPPFDPCDVYEYTTLAFTEDSSTTCNTDEPCGAFSSSHWYNFGDRDISSYLNQSYSGCSSNELVWINESILNETSGIVDYTLCVQQGNNTCSKTVKAHSKQCSGYTVYNIPDTFDSTCEKICGNIEEKKWHVCRSPQSQDNVNGTDNSASERNTVNLMVLVFVVAVTNILL